MLGRFQIKRKVAFPRASGSVFKDSRKHTSHVFAPAKELVISYLRNPTLESWQTFQREYIRILRERLLSMPEKFEGIHRHAESGNYYIGCNCPTRTNPFLCRCHTVLALEFMKETYPDLEVDFTVFPYLNTDST